MPFFEVSTTTLSTRSTLVLDKKVNNKLCQHRSLLRQCYCAAYDQTFHVTSMIVIGFSSLRTWETFFSEINKPNVGLQNSSISFLRNLTRWNLRQKSTNFGNPASARTRANFSAHFQSADREQCQTIRGIEMWYFITSKSTSNINQ